MEKQVTSAPQYLEMGGSGYLYLHYRPPVDRVPAINVDMVNGADPGSNSPPIIISYM